MTQFFKNLSALAFLMTLLSGCGQTPAARRSYIQPSTTMNYFDTSSTSSTAAPVVNTTLRCTLKVNDSLTSPVPVAPGSSTRFEVAAQGGSLLDYNFKRIVINGSQLTNFALRNTTRANNIATLDYTFSNAAILGDIPVTAYITYRKADNTESDEAFCSGTVRVQPIVISLSGSPSTTPAGRIELGVVVSGGTNAAVSIQYSLENRPDGIVTYLNGTTFTVEQDFEFQQQRRRVTGLRLVVRALNAQGQQVASISRNLSFLPPLLCRLNNPPTTVVKNTLATFQPFAVDELGRATGESLIVSDVRLDFGYQQYLTEVQGLGSAGPVSMKFTHPLDLLFIPFQIILSSADGTVNGRTCVITTGINVVKP